MEKIFFIVSTLLFEVSQLSTTLAKATIMQTLRHYNICHSVVVKKARCSLVFKTLVTLEFFMAERWTQQRLANPVNIVAAT